MNALSAMAKIFLISCVGVFCSKYPNESPLLPPESLRTLSRLSNLVLLPALIVVSLGSALSTQLVLRFMVLILFCLLTNLVSYAIAYTLGFWLFESDRELFVAASVAIGSPNAISFPLMLMQTLCEQQLVNSDYESNSTKCMAEANSMLFVYSIGWHLMFWSYGFPMLKTLSAAAGASAAAQGRPLNSIHAVSKWFQQTLFSPSMLAIYVGLLVGLVPVLQNAFFKDFSGLRPLGSALRTLSEPVVCINCLVMSANLAQIDVSQLRRGAQALSERMTIKFHGRTSSIVSMDAIETSSASSPIHTSREELEDEVVISGFERSGESYGGTSHDVPKPRSIATFLLCRLILPPLVMLPVLSLAVDAGIVGPSERMMQLVVCIESAAPSAQLIIVSLSQLGKPKLASQMAFLYLFQYLCTIFTVTAFTAVAMSQIYSG